MTIDELVGKYEKWVEEYLADQYGPIREFNIRERMARKMMERDIARLEGALRQVRIDNAHNA